MRLTDPDSQESSLHSRTAFHWALAGIFVPVVSLPFVWGLAMWAMLTRPRALGWALGTLALALADTAIAIAVITMPPLSADPPPEQPRYVIGITADQSVQDALVVDEVVDDSPAQAAGVLAGDIVLQVDGEDVHSVGDVSKIVQRTRDERRVTLQIERGEQSLEIDVTPIVLVRGPPEPLGLFENWAEGVDGWLARSVQGYRKFAPFGAALLLVLVTTRRRSQSPPGSLGIGAIMVLMLIAEPLAAFPVVFATGGPSAGSALIGSIFRCVVMIVVGLLAMRSLEPQIGSGGSATRPSLAGTMIIGAFYALTVALRVGALLIFMLGEPYLQESVSNPIEDLFGTPLSAPTQAWFAALVVLLGPIAEEVIFRGLLLGWLRSRVSDAAAIILSGGLFALLHPHYGPMMLVIFVYGVVLGWARIRSRGLTAPILMHVFMNGLILTVSSL